MFTEAIRANSSLPKHLELKGKLLRELSLGSFNIGDRFHSESFASRKYDVALLTVRRAYAALESEGFIEKKHGSGTYIRSLPQNIISQKIVQSCMIGLYIESSALEKDLVYSMFIRDFAKYLNIHGMSTTLIFDDFDFVHNKGLDGLIFFQMPDSKKVSIIQAMKLPTVSIGAERIKSFPGICQAKDFMYGIFTRFLKKGRRKISLLNFDSPSDFNNAAYSQLEKAISDFGAGEYIELTGERKNYESILFEALKSPDSPDAFFLPKWTYISGYMLTLARLNLKIGVDVGAFVNICPDFLSGCLPAHSFNPIESQTKLTVEMLEKMLKDKNYKGEVIDYEPQIVNQGSF